MKATWRQIPRAIRLDPGSACLCLCLLSAKPVSAQAFLEDMELIGFGFGGRSSLAASLRRGTGMLSDGTVYSFKRYYSTDIPDVRITMLSPINSNFGIIWGFGTGEKGQKYRIEPSLKIGFLATQPMGDKGLLSVSVSTVLGGHFREGTCTADYGAIGGTQTVNCRLADSILPPSETLKYLLNEPPTDRVSVSLRYQLRF